MIFCANHHIFVFDHFPAKCVNGFLLDGTPLQKTINRPLKHISVTDILCKRLLNTYIVASVHIYVQIKLQFMVVFMSFLAECSSIYTGWFPEYHSNNPSDKLATQYVG